MNRRDDFLLNPTIKSFNPSTSIPSLTNRTILVTGGTAGIGTQTLLYLAAHHPSRLIFAGRNASSAREVIQKVKAVNPDQDIVFVAAEFSSLESVAGAAKRILNENEDGRLDTVFCNAGVMLVHGVSKDGYEMHFAVNHLAHALLIRILLPLLQRTAKLPDADVRVISTTSLGALFAENIGIPIDKLKVEKGDGLDMGFMGRWKKYGISKLANILYAQSLSSHYPSSGITFLSTHPGVINTGLVSSVDVWNRLFIFLTTWWKTVSVEDGAKNGIWAAFAEQDTERKAVRNGGFYEPVGVLGRETVRLTDAKLAEELWVWTEGVIGPYL